MFGVYIYGKKEKKMQKKQMDKSKATKINNKPKSQLQHAHQIGHPELVLIAILQFVYEHLSHNFP